jgi:hypothetical protein
LESTATSSATINLTSTPVVVGQAPAKATEVKLSGAVSLSVTQSEKPVSDVSNMAVALAASLGKETMLAAQSTMSLMLDKATSTTNTTATNEPAKTYNMAVLDFSKTQNTGSEKVDLKAVTGEILVLKTSTGTDGKTMSLTLNNSATEASGPSTYVMVMGAATIRGGEGSQTVVGDAGAQDIMLGADDDQIYGGGGNDTLGSAAGNDLIDGGAGNDVVFGGIGNDTLIGGTGDDTLRGDEGIDTAKFTGARSEYKVSIGQTSKATNTSGTGGSTSNPTTTPTTLTPPVTTLQHNLEGNDSLSTIERLEFADVKLAIDLNGNAGQVAKILGAVFGKAAVQDKAYAGIGLFFLDNKLADYEGLMKLAIEVKLGTTAPTPTQVVDLLYTNVVGVAPSAADKAPFVNLLETGAFNNASLGVMAADTSFNTTNIDLVGLQLNGLLYLSP